MATPKKYFQDHLVLLLLSVNAFLAIVGSIFILVRLSTSHGGNGFIVQYRSNLGANAFKNGSVSELLSFVAFIALVMAVNTLLSLHTYKIHRQLAIVILSLGILLLVLTVIVSNALLVLR